MGAISGFDARGGVDVGAGLSLGAQTQVLRVLAGSLKIQLGGKWDQT